MSVLLEPVALLAGAVLLAVVLLVIAGLLARADREDRK